MPPRRTASRSASRASPRGRHTALSNAELDYTSPDFDPGTITKPRLRSLLAAHGVALPPPAARKDVLLALFEAHIRPLGANRTFPTKVTRAVTEATPKATPTSIEFSSDRSSSRAPRGRSRAPRREQRVSDLPLKETKMVLGETFAHRKPSVSPSRRKILSIASDIGTVATAGPARLPSPTKRTITKSVSPVSSPTRRRRGSRSPVKSAVQGRETNEDGISADINKRSPTRKSPNGPTVHGHRTPSRSPTKTPPSVSVSDRLATMLPKAADTPRSATAKLHGCLVAATEDEPPQPSVLLRIAKIVLLILVAVPILAISAYAVLKILVSLPYCSNCSSHVSEPSVLSALDSALRRGCVPCPPHGRCVNGALACPEGRILKPHWVALGASCVPDAALLSLVEDTAAQIVRVLGERYAAAACAGRLAEAGHVVSESALADVLFSRRLWKRQAIVRGHSFGSVFRAALADVQKRSGLLGITATHSLVDGALLLSVSSAPLGLWCRARLGAAARWRRAKPVILPVAALLTALTLAVLRLRGRRRTAQAVDALVVSVLRILAEQAAAHAADAREPPGVSVVQLRDALFVGAGAGPRAKLWPAVCRAVARNANVREAVVSVRGEAHRVWEWIGPDVLAPRAA